VFRAQEVCELAELQPYVLRTWEAEFPDLGVAKGNTGPRVYRRADVERVLLIKHLLFVDGLTLAGARKRLGDQQPVEASGPVSDAEVAALIDGETREQLRNVRRGLQWILGVLAGEGLTPSDFVLQPEAHVARARPKKAPAKASKPVARMATKVTTKKKRK